MALEHKSNKGDPIKKSGDQAPQRSRIEKSPAEKKDWNTRRENEGVQKDK